MYGGIKVYGNVNFVIFFRCKKISVIYEQVPHIKSYALVFTVFEPPVQNFQYNTTHYNQYDECPIHDFT